MFRIVLVPIGLILRLKVREIPLFQQLEAKEIPFTEVLTRYPKDLILGITIGTSTYTLAGMVTVWAVSYTGEAGSSNTSVLNAKANNTYEHPAFAVSDASD